MKNNENLIRKLRKEWPVGPGNRVVCATMDEAADTIEALETQLASAKKALGPFADHAKERVVDEPEWRDNYTLQIVVTIGELRQARAALEAKP